MGEVGGSGTAVVGRGVSGHAMPTHAHEQCAPGSREVRQQARLAVHGRASRQAGRQHARGPSTHSLSPPRLGTRGNPFTGSNPSRRRRLRAGSCPGPALPTNDLPCRGGSGGSGSRGEGWEVRGCGVGEGDLLCPVRGPYWCTPPVRLDD